MIKPAFFKHADLYRAEVESGLPLRLAFAGLWTVADREGRFKWKPDLKPDVLPYDPVDMLAVLSALASFGFVQRYDVAGKEYGFIPSFREHQTFHHTERASTIPAPCNSPLPHGESPVKAPADTVAVTVAVTATDTERIVVDDARSDEAASPVAEPQLTAIYLSIWANTAVTERWGERPSPYRPAQCEQMAAALREKGVEWQIARASIYEQCRTMSSAVPPRAPNYFRPGIETSMDDELARRAVVASGEVPPPVTLSPTPRRSSSRPSIGERAFATSMQALEDV